MNPRARQTHGKAADPQKADQFMIELFERALRKDGKPKGSIFDEKSARNAFSKAASAGRIPYLSGVQLITDVFSEFPKHTAEQICCDAYSLAFAEELQTDAEITTRHEGLRGAAKWIARWHDVQPPMYVGKKSAPEEDWFKRLCRGYWFEIKQNLDPKKLEAVS